MSRVPLFQAKSIFVEEETYLKDEFGPIIQSFQQLAEVKINMVISFETCLSLCKRKWNFVCKWQAKLKVLEDVNQTNMKIKMKRQGNMQLRQTIEEIREQKCNLDSVFSKITTELLELAGLRGKISLFM